MGVQPKEWITKLPRYEPGRPLEEVARELGLEGVDDLIKMASNENALGPSPRAVAAMQAAAERTHLYPDGGAYYLRNALAERLNVDVSNILPGNGSNELIELLGHTFLTPSTGIVMSDHAFIIYKLVAMLFNARTVSTPMREFTHDLDAMLAAITPETRLVFVANPNNPTGTQVSAEALDRFVRAVPDHVLVVLDEAYIDFLPAGEQRHTLNYVREGLPVCLLRTFSKGYGLAGLRVGYAVGSAGLISLLNRTRQPFNLNALAQTAALAALDDEDHLAATRHMTTEGLKQLTEGLDAIGVASVPSCANFLLARVGEGRSVFQALEEKHIIVRPMDGYGLPEYIRVTVGTAAENDRFLRALASLSLQQDSGSR